MEYNILIETDFFNYAVDLVEMVYGICVMGSVNDGDVKFKDLA